MTRPPKTSPSKATLPLQLVSMRLPEAMDWIRRPQDEADRGNVLQLTPGMASEIALKFENSGSQPIHWSLEMTGNFPASWYCAWDGPQDGEGPQASDSSANGNTNGNANGQAVNPEASSIGGAVVPISANSSPYQIDGTIQPRTISYHSIQLKVPENFFEHQAALSHQPKLELNYSGEIYLFAQWQDQQRLAGYQALQLEVRPVCDYMTFLPEIFQSEDFMSRFLSIFEQAFDPCLQTLNMLQTHLDPLTAPRSMLPFLSKWVAWEMDPRWSLKQQRRLMRYAIELYRWRGTRRGLRYYLHLYTDLPLDEGMPEAEKRISITDETQNAFVFGQARLGDPSTFNSENGNGNGNGSGDGQPFAFGGGKPFHFKVVLRPDRSDQIDESSVRQVIEQVKPAFCTYELQIQPKIRVSNRFVHQ